MTKVLREQQRMRFGTPHRLHRLSRGDVPIRLPLSIEDELNIGYVARDGLIFAFEGLSNIVNKAKEVGDLDNPAVMAVAQLVSATHLTMQATADEIGLILED